MAKQLPFEYVVMQIASDQPFACGACQKVFATHGCWIAARARSQDGPWYGVGEIGEIACPQCGHTFAWAKIYPTISAAQQACNMMNSIGHGLAPLLSLQHANASEGGS